MTSQFARDIGSLPLVCLTRNEPPQRCSQSRVVHKAATCGNNGTERVPTAVDTLCDRVRTAVCVTTGTHTVLKRCIYSMISLRLHPYHYNVHWPCKSHVYLGQTLLHLVLEELHIVRRAIGSDRRRKVKQDFRVFRASA